MRNRYALASAVALLLALAPAAHATTGFSATITGGQEVPPSGSPGFGNASFVLDNSQTNLSYSVTFCYLVGGLTASHIHQAPPGTNGPIIVPLNIGAASGLMCGSFSGVATVTPAIVTAMLNGQTYINLHSLQFPGGEIRGQIAVNATPVPRGTWGRLKMLYH